MVTIMAHFAKIENNIVTQVIVISNDVCGEPTLVFPNTENAGQAFIANILKLDGEWKQTSYNGNYRGVYAGIGWTYDPVKDVFIEPQPYPSWTLDENNNWQPPTPNPMDGTNGYWNWNEETTSWVKVD